MDANSINYNLIHSGSIIAYRLLPSMLPLNPHKIWKGRVIRMYGGTLLTVEMLEPGYHGLTEYVYVSQIVAVSEAKHMNSTNAFIGNLIGYYKPPSDAVHFGKVVEVKRDIDLVFVVEPDCGGALEQVPFQDVVKDENVVVEAMKRLRAS